MLESMSPWRLTFTCPSPLLLLLLPSLYLVAWGNVTKQLRRMTILIDKRQSNTTFTWVLTSYVHYAVPLPWLHRYLLTLPA